MLARTYVFDCQLIHEGLCCSGDAIYKPPRLDPDSSGIFALLGKIIYVHGSLYSLCDTPVATLIARYGPRDKENIGSIMRKVRPPVGDPLVPAKGALILYLRPTLSMNSMHPNDINYELVVSLVLP